MAEIKDAYAELEIFKKKLRKKEPDLFGRETGVLTAGGKKRQRAGKRPKE
ncbi:MAG: hypothetical protein QXH30_02125 [Candidatus Bilamarchaeaceae archaeon]